MTLLEYNQETKKLENKEMNNNGNRTVRKLSVKQKIKVKEKANYICKYCGCRNPLIMTVDHKIPLTRGGTDDEDNLVCCCEVCNKLKSHKTDEEFSEYSQRIGMAAKMGFLILRPLDIAYKFRRGGWIR